MATREDMVKAGAQFLRHPDVVGVPGDQRAAFLKEKGLTDSEVAAAAQAAGVSLAPSAPPPAGGPMVVYQPAPAPCTPWWWRLLQWGITLSAGAGAYRMYQDKLEPNTPKPPSPAEAAAKEAVERLEQANRDLRADVADLRAQVQRLHETHHRRMHDTLDATNRVLSEVKAELAALRAGGAAPAPSGAPAGGTSAAVGPFAPGGVGFTESTHVKTQRVKAEVDRLLAGNPPSVFLAGASALIMFVSNLVNHPTEPRYRRLLTSNSSFTNTIAPMESHADFLKAVGFEQKSGVWEFKWSAATQKTTTEVLEAALAALQAAKAKAASKKPDPSERTGARRPLFSSPPTTAAPTPPPQPPVDSFPPTTTPAGQRMAMWAAQQGPLAANGNGYHGMNGTAAAPSPASTPAAVFAAPVAAVPAASPAPTPVVAPTSSTTASEEPQAPQSFAELMRSVQRGETPPGIKDIPDELSAHEPAPPQSAPPLKPWEKTDKTHTSTPLPPSPTVDSTLT